MRREPKCMLFFRERASNPMLISFPSSDVAMTALMPDGANEVSFHASGCRTCYITKLWHSASGVTVNCENRLDGGEFVSSPFF